MYVLIDDTVKLSVFNDDSDNEFAVKLNKMFIIIWSKIAILNLHGCNERTDIDFPI